MRSFSQPGYRPPKTMHRSYLDPPRPIAALATLPGESALAIIRCSGPGSIELAARLFSRPERLLAPGRPAPVHGFLVDPEAQGGLARLDEVMATAFRGPVSPTGEDSIEFSCHGSPAVLRKALALLEQQGFAPALPGEFSFRAFSNGKLDLTRAEAIAELVAARSEAARAGAMERLEGGLSRRLGLARETLLDLQAQVELRLDYGEDEAGEALDPAGLSRLRSSLASLASSFASCRLVSDGLRVVLAGAPNAGKSSLFNLLLREERSIVSPEAGTTRDWIESEIEVGGLRLRLIDTAGLREARGQVEAQGVARSQGLVAEAEILVFLADASEPLPEEDELLAQLGRRDLIRIWNKADLMGSSPVPPGWLALSALDGRGLPAFIAALEGAARSRLEQAKAVPGAEPGPGGVGIDSPRHKLLLDRCLGAIDSALEGLGAGEGLDVLALDLREAADSLGEITGEITTPEILEAIFSKFCVGK